MLKLIVRALLSARSLAEIITVEEEAYLVPDAPAPLFAWGRILAPASTGNTSRAKSRRVSSIVFFIKIV